MGVNLVASKVDTDYEELKFPNIVEKYLFEEEDCDSVDEV